MFSWVFYCAFQSSEECLGWQLFTGKTVAFSFVLSLPFISFIFFSSRLLELFVFLIRTVSSRSKAKPSKAKHRTMKKEQNFETHPLIQTQKCNSNSRVKKKESTNSRQNEHLYRILAWRIVARIRKHKIHWTKHRLKQEKEVKVECSVRERKGEGCVDNWVPVCSADSSSRSFCQLIKNDKVGAEVKYFHSCFFFCIFVHSFRENNKRKFPLSLCMSQTQFYPQNIFAFPPFLLLCFFILYSTI